MEIYTPIEKAGDIIKQRWADEKLRKAVEEKLKGDIPEILKDGPCGLIWRCICTPDGEFDRFLRLCKKVDLEPVGFEYTQDRFYPGNFTKYGLTNLAFSKGLNKNGKHIITKEKIIDFETIKGKTLRMCDLKTLWGENLVDSHHFLLDTIFPTMKDRVIDMSSFFKKRGGKAKEYYSALITFTICHFVLFEDFDLIESEKGFIYEIVLPACEEVQRRFGTKPVIVKISETGEHDKDPHWWCYSKESKIIMDNHIKNFK